MTGYIGNIEELTLANNIVYTIKEETGKVTEDHI